MPFELVISVFLLHFHHFWVSYCFIKGLMSVNLNTCWRKSRCLDDRDTS